MHLQSTFIRRVLGTSGILIENIQPGSIHMFKMHEGFKNPVEYTSTHLRVKMAKTTATYRPSHACTQTHGHNIGSIALYFDRTVLYGIS